MTDFLYNLIIFPVIQIIDLSFYFLFRVSRNYGLSVLGVSLIVSGLTFPLYYTAERWQLIERTIQNKMKAGIKKIKTVFSGDEQYLILSTYYRQNHYHPVYAMRSSFGILLQIPFFISAYSFLSHLEVLKGASFIFLKDLGSPDALLTSGSLSFNILPVLMTLINVLSGLVYTRGFLLREKIQLYGMAVIFLLLLYNSPSGLVLYWTMNNIFSLIKNIVLRMKNPKKTTYFILCFPVIFFDIYVLFFHRGYFVKRLSAAAVVSIILLLPLLKNIFIKIRKKAGEFIEGADFSFNQKIFFLSSICIFLLAGAVIPSALIASSTQEFSYIESYMSPFPFVFTVINQALGLFVLWPACIYFLFSASVKKYLAFILSLLLFLFCINTFVFQGDYGFITTTLVLSNPGTFLTNIPLTALNILCLLLVLVLFSVLYVSRFKKIIISFLSIILAAFIGVVTFNLTKIGSEFNALKKISARDAGYGSELLRPVFTFSRNGKNVIVIMLDRAMSAWLPVAFKEKPELNDSFAGFTWFPNSVSFGSFTIFGAPPLYGGYEYTPAEFQKGNTQPLIDKYNESLMMMPKLFLDHHFKVVVTDPPWANFSWKPDLSIYKPLLEEEENLLVDNLSGKYSSYWLEKNPEAQVVSISEILRNNLIRFSLFKTSPVLIRGFIFDRGRWLSSARFADDKQLNIITIDNYAVLDLLPDITGFIEEGNTFSLFANQLTHEPAVFQFPGYVPVLNVTDTGNGPYSGSADYHANMAAFILLGKWFDHLRANGVYDNTRIIIVSDHGANTGGNFPYQIKLPGGDGLQAFNVLLMAKDFNARESLQTDNTFMTNADVPLLALDSLVENPVNPFTQKALKSDKAGRIMLTTSRNLSPVAHHKYTFKIKRDEWLSVQNDIFDLKNWQRESVSIP